MGWRWRRFSRYTRRLFTTNVYIYIYIFGCILTITASFFFVEVVKPSKVFNFVGTYVTRNIKTPYKRLICQNCRNTSGFSSSNIGAVSKVTNYCTLNGVRPVRFFFWRPFKPIFFKFISLLLKRSWYVKKNTRFGRNSTLFGFFFRLLEPRKRNQRLRPVFYNFFCRLTSKKVFT